MARKEETVTETLTPPAAEAVEEETFEVELPQGVVLEGVEDTPPPAAPASAVAPKDAPPEPTPVKDKPKVPVAALKSERKKRQAAEAANERLREDLKRILSTREQGTPTEATPKKPVPEFRPKLDAFRARIPQIKADYAKAFPELEQPTEALLSGVAQLIDDLDGHYRTRTAEVDARLDEAVSVANDLRLRHRVRIQRLEGVFRAAHKDYDDTLTRAGIWQDVAEKGGDPVTALMIYTADNPVEEAYKLAVERLKKRGEWEGEEEPDEGGEPGDETPETPKGAAPKAGAETPAPDAVAEAERRGRAEVAAAVTNHAAKPKGIRNVRSAGGTRVAGLSREYLMGLLESDYEKFQRVIAQNGGKEGRLYRWLYHADA